MTPNRRVTWQRTSDGGNCWPHSAARRRRGRSRRMRSTRTRPCWAFSAVRRKRGEYQIADLAAEYRLPTMMANDTFTGRGGLISYGADTRDLNRQAGVYIGRILRGEKPADLAVVQPSTFALRVNLKTAKALGLSIPESFLLLADEVIE